MPIRAVEISKNFLIFLFSPPYLDSSISPLRNRFRPLRNHFFHLLRPFLELEKKIFLGNFLIWHFLGLFGQIRQSMACWGSNRSVWPGRSSPAIKFQDFWLEHLFPIFFGTFCKFLAISAKNSFFSSFLPLSRQTNDKFGNFPKIFKASSHYLGKKLVEITQIDRNDVISRVFFPFPSLLLS